MNRRKFINLISATGAAATIARVPSTLAAADSGVNAPLPSTPLAKGTPAVFAATENGFTVSIPLAAPALVWIEYGETPQLGAIARADSFGFVPHDDVVVKISIRNLKSGARYYWRSVTRPALPYIGNLDAATLGSPEEIRSKIYTTKTLSPRAPETRFSIWNDTHDHHETIRALHAARKDDDDFLLRNGDMSNNVNDRDLLASLYVCPPGVDLADGPPVLVTRGNHDVRGLWANKMSDYVEYPDGPHPWYAFRTGPVGIIALDTGEDKPDDHRSFRGVAAFEPLIREQASWLEEIVRRPDLRDAPYRVVICHIPLRWIDETPPDYAGKGFDRFSLRARLAWHDALVRWGAQVVLSGHTHRHAWLPPAREFPYGQLVGGGPRMERATLIRVHASPERLNLQMARLQDGAPLQDLNFKPLAKVA
ncbi:putative phosphohydrolase [Opitutaceae bacterium TAV1]|nr:putative phosphohydrolase [Opitutaceae bacterium TAV1]